MGGEDGKETCASFCAIYTLKCVILPRQARDKHRETSKKRVAFLQGNISMTYYTNGFDSNNTHQKTHPMVSGGGGMEPHPNTTLEFYTDLFQYNQEHFNMEHLFTDFLCYRRPSMAQYQDVPAGEEGEHMWLGGMSMAAQVSETPKAKRNDDTKWMTDPGSSLKENHWTITNSRDFSLSLSLSLSLCVWRCCVTLLCVLRILVWRCSIAWLSRIRSSRACTGQQ